MKEKWKSIKRAPGFSISNMGRIRNDMNNMIVPLDDNSDGYLFTTVRLNDETIVKLIAHIEVSRAFSDDYMKGIHVHHVNANKHDNRISNLKNLDSYSHSIITRSMNGALSEEKVNNICMDLEIGMLNKHELCSKYKINKSRLGSIIRGKSYKHISKKYNFHKRYRKKEDLTREKYFSVDFIFDDDKDSYENYRRVYNEY